MNNADSQNVELTLEEITEETPALIQQGNFARL